MKLTIALLMVVAVVLSTVAAEDEHEHDGHDGHDGQNGYIHLPGKNCEEAPPCPDGRPCMMAPPRCNSGTCGTDPVPTCGTNQDKP